MSRFMENGVRVHLVVSFASADYDVAAEIKGSVQKVAICKQHQKLPIGERHHQESLGCLDRLREIVQKPIPWINWFVAEQPNAHLPA